MSIKTKTVGRFLQSEFGIKVQKEGVELIKDAFCLDAVIDGSELLGKSELTAKDVESCIRMFRRFEFNEDVELTDEESSLIDGLDRSDLPTGSYGYYESLRDYRECYEDDDSKPDVVKIKLPEETIWYETYQEDE